ncbi:4-(cytidine 5'-diphospho)-2-C-methyl-D-erythritol kinase [Spiractinospora alimapuensis]|uniref:4-(cytidine 5'-diphospho)-2-C-methyl-D-erythritol kinase n=1 Tax=Spiractinospora alimapuensis TaxID=2820884 RepID=UPI001F34D585
MRVPAKVNLRLAVGPPRGDGFHPLVNVFHAVSLFDELDARLADPSGDFVTLSVEGAGAGVPLGADNLVVRAAELLAAETGNGRPVAIRLHKAIPVAGGMAGGSADAAAALRACDALWETRLGDAELNELAARLGSDVPFALLGGTAEGTGRGEHLTPLPTEGRLDWVFALADGGLSTAEVYRVYDEMYPEAPAPTSDAALAKALAEGDRDAVGRALSNDLQDVAVSLRPDLGVTLDAGRSAGALGALVSGSGPTCAFLADSPTHAAELAERLEAGGHCARAVTAQGPVPGATIVAP